MATYALPTGHQYLEARVNWSQTQNIEANTSTVTAYIEARRTSSYMTTADGYNPKLTFWIDGQERIQYVSYNFGSRAVGTWFSIGSSVSATVGHNGDGTRSINIATLYDTSVSNLGYLSKVQPVALNTIPRASTISGGQDWVIGHNSEIYINRKSTDYYHSVFIDIGYGGVWQGFAERHGVGANVNTNFSEIEQGAMMDLLIIKGNPWEIQSRIRLETYSSSGYQVGTTTTITGTIWRPAESSIGSQSSLELTLAGAPYTLSGVNSSSWITHSLKLFSNAFSTTITLANGASLTGNITLTQAQIDSLYAQYTTQAYAPFNIESTTLLAGRQLGNKKTVTAGDGTLTFNSEAIDPNLTVTPTYADTNTAITAITTNNQHIVQNKSNLKVTIPAGSATAKYGATLVNYSVSVNGVEKKVAYSSSGAVVDFGLVNATFNTTAQVSVIDSRGLRASKSIQVIVFPYSQPTISGVASRLDGFDSNTALSASGAFSSVNAKNTINNVKYRYKSASTGTWGAYANLTVTPSGATYTTNAPVVSLENTLTFNIEFVVTDILGGTTTSAIYVDTGKPIMFIDKEKKSIGIGKFPTNSGSFETDGDSYVAGDGFISGNLTVAGDTSVSGTLNATGAMNMNGALNLLSKDGTGLKRVYPNSKGTGWFKDETTGLVLQWGYGIFTPTGSVYDLSRSLPVGMPTDFHSVYVSIRPMDVESWIFNGSINAYSYNTSSFRAIFSGLTSGKQYGYYFFAIGE